MTYAQDNPKVKKMKTKLHKELGPSYRISVQWEDRKAQFAEMIIEGKRVISREKFDDITGEENPGVFSFNQYPGLPSSTVILFHA